MQVTRRQFFKVSAAGLGASSVAALGFSPGDALAEVREFKLTGST
jgi:formate dehydrogenase major subunit